MPFSDEEYLEVVDSIKTWDILDTFDKMEEVYGTLGIVQTGSRPR